MPATRDYYRTNGKLSVAISSKNMKMHRAINDSFSRGPGNAGIRVLLMLFFSRVSTSAVDPAKDCGDFGLRKMFIFMLYCAHINLEYIHPASNTDCQ